MNRVGKAALGCFLFPIGIAILGLIVFAGARAVGVPDARVAQKELRQPLEPEVASEAATELAPRLPAESTHEAEPGMIVILDMEEGHFTVEPGPTEDGIRVEAEYDEATYKLEKEYSLKDETPVFRLRFRSTVSMLRRLAQGGFDSNDMNRNDIAITLPEGMPMKLVLAFRRAEAEVQLDGIALTDLVTKFRMGEYTVVSQASNPILMRRFEGDFAMGEFEVDGLANFRAAFLSVNGQMGEMRMDFRESLARDTVMDISWRMGQVGLRVPSDAFWDPSSSVSATLGEVTNGRPRTPADFDPELSKRLKVDASVMMGEIRVEENPSRGVGMR